MKRNMLLIMLFIADIAVAQQIHTGIQMDSLILKMQDVIIEQKNIEVAEIKGVYRITPWHFVPSLNYDFINNRYYLTVSSGPLVTNMINKRQEKRKLSVIDRRYDNQSKSSEIKLKNSYLSFIQKNTNIQLSHEIILNDIEIFKIKSQQHANHEIDTESFLKEKSSILNKIKNHNAEVADIQRYLLDIELLTEYQIELDLLQFYVSPLVISLPCGEGRGGDNPFGGKGGFK